MIRHPFTFYNTKKNNAACDWQQIGILSGHNTNSTNFLNIKLGTHFIVWYPVLLSFLIFSDSTVLLICASPKEVFHIKATLPKSRWHLRGRTLSMQHAPSQRLRFQHVNHMDTSMVSWVSLQMIGSTRATLMWQNLIVLHQAKFFDHFWSLFSLVK